MASKLTAWIVATMLLLASAAHADTISFKFRSNAENSVGLEFSSQMRDHQWPGNDRAYKIDDYEVHSYKLSCVSGEQICYGAWVEGDDTQYWGVGMNNEQHCTDCCFVCNQNSKVKLINLNE